MSCKLNRIHDFIYPLQTYMQYIISGILAPLVLLEKQFLCHLKEVETPSNNKMSKL